MKTLGIVAEYNPFHNGHKFHIAKSKQETKCKTAVVVMSGNFVQRGDCSILDKFTRAKEAVINGADLVVELPFCYSSQSAEIFAKGSMEILNGLGVVDVLCYGSESNDVQAQQIVAKLLAFESEELQFNIKKHIKTGISFPKAREIALLEILGNKSNLAVRDIISSSNDILGVEYIKNLLRLGSAIKPHSIKRISSTYNDTDIKKAYPSATSIRKIFDKETLKSEEAIKLLTNATTGNIADYLISNNAEDNLNNMDKYYNELKLIIIREGENINRYFEVNEGIENLIIKNICQCNSLEELIEKIKTKRYTRTRIRRMLLNILIGLKKEDMKTILTKKTRPYARVLAFNENGREILRKINDNQNLETILINKPSSFRPIDEVQELIWNYDNVANSIYYSKFKIISRNSRVYSDMKMSPIYIKQ